MSIRTVGIDLGKTVFHLIGMDDNGKIVHWIGETQNPVTMTDAGWSKSSFKVGDEVTVALFPVKNGLPLGRIINVVLPSGKTLDANPNQRPYR